MNINPNKPGVLEFIITIIVVAALLAFTAGVIIGRLQTVEPVPEWIRPIKPSDK